MPVRQWANQHDFNFLISTGSNFVVRSFDLFFGQNGRCASLITFFFFFYLKPCFYGQFGQKSFDYQLFDSFAQFNCGVFVWSNSVCVAKHL